jgi:hypothetical protein
MAVMAAFCYESTYLAPENIAPPGETADEATTATKKMVLKEAMTKMQANTSDISGNLNVVRYEGIIGAGPSMDVWTAAPNDECGNVIGADHHLSWTAANVDELEWTDLAATDCQSGTVMVAEFKDGRWGVPWATTTMKSENLMAANGDVCTDGTRIAARPAAGTDEVEEAMTTGTDAEHWMLCPETILGWRMVLMPTTILGWRMVLMPTTIIANEMTASGVYFYRIVQENEWANDDAYTMVLHKEK